MSNNHRGRLGMRVARRFVPALLGASALMAAAFGTGSAGAASAGMRAAAARPAAATPGVTKTTISLGLDVARSGLAAPLTVPFIQGIQTFWGNQNYTFHGVCGRKINLVFGDNGGDPQTELTAY